jgi:hypothetical protein
VAYNYLVRALDQSTLRFDGNAAEASATPTGPGSGVQIVFDEDFWSLSAFNAWTVENSPKNKTCGIFSFASVASQLPAGGSGGHAKAYAVNCGNPPVTSILTSPAIDLNLPGVETVTLEYDIYYQYGDGSDEATVEVWDGSAWQEIWRDADISVNTHQSFDVTAFAAGNPAFQVRFFYDDGDQWLSVDNVVVTADIVNPCETVVGPAPAPDGRGGTGALTVESVTMVGDTLQVSWDAASCTAGDYHLLYGDLADVGTYMLAGSECSLGISGTYTWNPTPAGNLFFLIVGADGNGTESSWGLDSSFGERNGAGASGQCGSVAKDASAGCP